MPLKLKYGDEYDIVEEIFSDNEEILENIKNNRREKVIGIARTINRVFEDDPENYGKPLIESERYKEIKEKTFKYSEYYLKDESKKTTSKLEIKSDIEQKLDDAKKLSDIMNILVKSHSELDTLDFSKSISRVTRFYALKELNDNENFEKKQAILEKTQEVLDGIFEVFPEDVDKDKFGDIIKLFPSQSTREFIEKNEMVQKLKSVGIDVDLLDERFSFIDACDEDKNNTFYEELKDRKKYMTAEDFTIKNFAMVRTTPFLTKNREMEIIDELNSREYISNFLTNKFYMQDLIKEFGENWFDEIHGNPDKEKGEQNLKKSNEMLKKYETLSPMYRSTKHFTLNGLVSSHEYGNFEGNPYIFIDSLEEHINDEDMLSINEADTYFKKSREKPIKLSNNAEIMMPLEEYLKIMRNPEIMEEISKYKKITVFSGNEKIAVDMRLSQMGYIPEDIGKWGYPSDSVHDKAIFNISKQYDIPVEVHFYSDIKREDQDKTNEITTKLNEEFVDTMFERFGIEEKYRKSAINQNLSDEELDEIIVKCGEDNLKSFITEFNDQTRQKLDKKRDEFYASKEKTSKKDEVKQELI